MTRYLSDMVDRIEEVAVAVMSAVQPFSRLRCATAVFPEVITRNRYRRGVRAVRPQDGRRRIGDEIEATPAEMRLSRVSADRPTRPRAPRPSRWLTESQDAGARQVDIGAMEVGAQLSVSAWTS